MKYKLEYELFSYISEFLIDFAYTVMICAVIFCAQIMITPRFVAILAGMLTEATLTFSHQKPLRRREHIRALYVTYMGSICYIYGLYMADKL